MRDWDMGEILAAEMGNFAARTTSDFSSTSA